MTATLFPDADEVACGANSPAPLVGFTCQRTPGHLGPHWRNGPRLGPGRPHAWSVDWRDDQELTDTTSAEQHPTQPQPKEKQ